LVANAPQQWPDALTTSDRHSVVVSATVWSSVSRRTPAAIGRRRDRDEGDQEFDRASDRRAEPDGWAAQDANQSVAEHVYSAPQPSLAAGQTLVYRMTIENPPAEAQRAAITFTDRPVAP
jgi:hypothetical protein